jgi:Rhodopirellula transposase DDE domain
LTKIEHQLLAHVVSMNWRDRPLNSHEVVVDLIVATTTRTRLTVKAEASTTRREHHQLPRPIKIIDQEMDGMRRGRCWSRWCPARPTGGPPFPANKGLHWDAADTPVGQQAEQLPLFLGLQQAVLVLHGDVVHLHLRETPHIDDAPMQWALPALTKSCRASIVSSTGVSGSKRWVRTSR